MCNSVNGDIRARRAHGQQRKASGERPQTAACQPSTRRLSQRKTVGSYSVALVGISCDVDKDGGTWGPRTPSPVTAVRGTGQTGNDTRRRWLAIHILQTRFSLQWGAQTRPEEATDILERGECNEWLPAGTGETGSGPSY